MSEVTGKAAVLPRVQRLYPAIDAASPVLAAVVSALKSKEFEGYSYEAL